MKLRAILLLVGPLAVAAFPACSGTAGSPTDGGAPDGTVAPLPTSTVAPEDSGPRVTDGPVDNPALYGRPSTCGGSGPVLPDAGRLDGGRADSGASCYDVGSASVLKAKAPVKGQNVCTLATIAALRGACLGSTPSGDCKTVTDANKECARCIFGAFPGDSVALTRAPALLPTGESSLSPNVAACAALVVGRPDCALPLSKQVVCTSSACSSCAKEESASCQAEAACGVCATVAYSPECTAATAQAAAWEATCRGANFDETYTKVANYLCGAP